MLSRDGPGPSRRRCHPCARRQRVMGSSARILVAEDNPALSGVIRFNLTRVGHEVTVARDGRQAWEVADKERFDLVITDHQMPVMTGVDLIRQLRQKPDYQRTPVIMLTAKGFELDIAKLREELGVAAALPKPFSPAELVGVVEQCLAEAVSV